MRVRGTGGDESAPRPPELLPSPDRATPVSPPWHHTSHTTTPPPGSRRALFLPPVGLRSVSFLFRSNPTTTAPSAATPAASPLASLKLTPNLQHCFAHHLRPLHPHHL
ncbi:unnamed protein product [Gadus morhua 'NCC']